MTGAIAIVRCLSLIPETHPKPGQVLGGPQGEALGGEGCLFRDLFFCVYHPLFIARC